jgi:hypothetical protein
LISFIQNDRFGLDSLLRNGKWGYDEERKRVGKRDKVVDEIGNSVYHNYSIDSVQPEGQV